LTDEQPARDLSRPPPRPAGATIGPGKPWEIFYYDDMVTRVVNEYDTRFASI
jgi:hypothetical protein